MSMLVSIPAPLQLTASIARTRRNRIIKLSYQRQGFYSTFTASSFSVSSLSPTSSAPKSSPSSASSSKASRLPTFSFTQDIPSIPSIPVPVDRSHVHVLLNHLCFYPQLLHNIKEAAAPSLASFIRTRHYAGARELLESFFSRIILGQQDEIWNVTSSDLNAIVSALLSLTSLPVAPSKAALTSLIDYAISNFLLHTRLFPIDMTTISLLTSQPQYLTPASVRDILTLLKRIEGAEDQIPDVKVLHSIMRVYAMHGMPEMAEEWMRAVLAAQAIHSVTPHHSHLYQEKGIYKHNSRSGQHPDASLFLGTTFISSYAHERVPLIDSRKAMSFFNSLRSGALTAKLRLHQLDRHESSVATAERRNGPIGALDVYAWTAILGVAANDTTRISAQALADVLSQLRFNGRISSIFVD